MKLALYIIVSVLVALTIYFVQGLELTRIWSSIITGVIIALTIYVYRTVLDKYRRR